MVYQWSENLWIPTPARTATLSAPALGALSALSPAAMKQFLDVVSAVTLNQLHAGGDKMRSVTS